MVFPVVGQRLVEGSVFLVGHFLGFAHPQGLALVQLFPFMGHFLHLLGLFLLLFLINFLNLGFVTFLVVLILLFLLFFLFGLGVGHLLFRGLLNVQFDGEADEFGMFLDQVLEAALL